MRFFIVHSILINIISILVISTSVLAETDINHLPFYGGTDRIEFHEITEQDNIFIANATRTFGTREHAAEGYVERGFDLYAENKLDESMEHFNQAWLLNQDNPYIYLGFGLLLNKKKEACDAAQMFKQANQKGLKESGFIADYAHTVTLCALTKGKKEQIELFDDTNKLYDSAIQTPNKKLKAYVYHNWAKSCFLQENYLKAQEMLQQSTLLNNKVDTELEQSIKAKIQEQN
jgi:tetratricopeptide (TPR) repeat protein